MGGFGGGPSTPLLGGNELKQHIPPWKLAALTISFLGVQFGWAIQIAFTTPIFLELGLSSFWVSFVWLAGPISGLVVQPIVGVLSDRNTSKWGRRRPFIFFGTLFIIIGMLSISNASSIGVALGDKDGHNPAAIVIAIIGFWILDLANNTVQGPCRAMLVDCAHADQQNLGGSFFSFMLGLGNLAGYLTGSQNLISAFPFFGTNVRALFTIGMCTLFICISITLVTIQEIPVTKEQVEAAGKVENPFVEIFKGVVGMPKAMRRVCLVQFFTWVAWFTYLLYMTAWVGTSIFHGDPNSDDERVKHLFDEGVRRAALGMAVNAVVTMIVSLILPKAADVIGIRPLYCFGQCVLALCLIMTVFVKTEVGAIILISACGIPWAVVMVFPFTLVSMAVNVSEAGKYMGSLNIFVVLPQICVSVGIGWIIRFFDGNYAAALGTGGLSAVISAFLVWTLITKRPEPVLQEVAINFDQPTYGRLE